MKKISIISIWNNLVIYYYENIQPKYNFNYSIWEWISDEYNCEISRGLHSKGSDFLYDDLIFENDADLLVFKLKFM